MKSQPLEAVVEEVASGWYIFAKLRYAAFISVWEAFSLMWRTWYSVVADDFAVFTEATMRGLSEEREGRKGWWRDWK